MQKLNVQFGDQFLNTFKWIVDNAESKKIEYVFGLGDTTDTSSVEEYERALTAFHSLDGVVDYSIVRGNLDKRAVFDTYFPWDFLKDTHDGTYDINTTRNTYRLFSVGQVDYLLINLDFGPADNILAWAGDLCEQYPDRSVIITTHTYLCRNGQPLTKDDHVPPTQHGYSNDGDHIWEKLVSKYENISLVFSGHDAGNRITMSQVEGRNGNIVTQMLINTSGLEAQSENGLGMVAMLYFSEDGKDVQVEYYSVVKDEYFRSINQFSFELDLADGITKYPSANAPEQGGNIYNGGTLNITGGEVYGGMANYGGNIYNAGSMNHAVGTVFGGIAFNGRNIYDATAAKMADYSKK